MLWFWGSFFVCFWGVCFVIKAGFLLADLDLQVLILPRFLAAPAIPKKT